MGTTSCCFRLFPRAASDPTTEQSLDSWPTIPNSPYPIPRTTLEEHTETETPTTTPTVSPEERRNRLFLSLIERALLITEECHIKPKEKEEGEEDI